MPKISKRTLLNSLLALSAYCLTVKTWAQAPAPLVSPQTRQAVAEFLRAHPEYAGEFMPFEQDCLDGKVTNPKDAALCDASVQSNLADLKDEFKLSQMKAEVNQMKAEVNQREAKVNRQAAITFPLSLVLNVGLIYSRINGIPVDRPKFDRVDEYLNSHPDPEFAAAVAVLKDLHMRLESGGAASPIDIKRLKDISVRYLGLLRLRYVALPPEEQLDNKDSKIILDGVHRLLPP